MNDDHRWTLSRRQVLAGGLAGAAGVATAGLAGCSGPAPKAKPVQRAAALDREAPGPPGSPLVLSVDGLVSPIGLDPADVHFAWQVGDLRRGALQTAYRLVVSRRSVAGPGIGTSTQVWDSGRVPGTAQAFVPYGGPTLASDATYAWTVQTWAASGGPGPFAPRSTFETGLRDPDWKAQWIWRATSLQPDQYTYPAQGGHAAWRAHRPGAGIRLGRPAIRAVCQRHPGGQRAGLLLPRRPVLRVPGRHSPPDRRRAERGGLGVRLAGGNEGPSRRASGLHRAGVGPPRRRLDGAHPHRRDLARAGRGLAARDRARPRGRQG